MSLRIFAFSLGCIVSAATPVHAMSGKCGLPEIGGSRDLHRFLSLRAVDVVKRATNPNDDQASLVSPTAVFSLGAGDVGRPLGTGVVGARELARTMKANTYRFLGWDYMDGPEDACTKHEVEVEFIDSRSKSISRVKFTFDAGRVVSASGWQKPFETGSLDVKVRTLREGTGTLITANDGVVMNYTGRQ